LERPAGVEPAHSGFADRLEEKGWVDMADFRRAMTFARAKWPKKK
jgi:hypothetical protein